MKPLLRGHPDKRPTSLERPLDNVNLYINVLISTPDQGPPLLKGHFSGAKRVASQEGHCKWKWATFYCRGSYYGKYSSILFSLSFCNCMFFFRLDYFLFFSLCLEYVSMSAIPQFSSRLKRRLSRMRLRRRCSSQKLSL